MSCDYTLQITITHRLVFSITVFTALLGSSFQQRSGFGFHVKQFMSSLADTFQLQLLRCINWLPTTELTHKSKSKLCYDRRSVGQSVLE
jgi:hypothetical protein